MQNAGVIRNAPFFGRKEKPIIIERNASNAAQPFTRRIAVKMCVPINAAASENNCTTSNT